MFKIIRKERCCIQTVCEWLITSMCDKPYDVLSKNLVFVRQHIIITYCHCNFNNHILNKLI